MIFRPSRQRTMQRLSLCGMLVAFVVQILAWSVMPVAAQGVSTSDGWMVICTGDGFKRISLTEAGISPDSSHNDTYPPSVLVEHCDLCVFAHGLGLGPAAVFSVEPGTGTRVVRLPAADSAVLDKSHGPQQPRAPPVSRLI